MESITSQLVKPAEILTGTILTAGKATFTLEGKGRRWTFRIERVESEDRPAIYFAKLLAGADNDNDYVYLGIYDPAHGWVKLTKASKLPESSEPVRALRWYVGLVLNDRENEIEQHGFHIHWATCCQRCGRTLTVPSSIDARLGPECVTKI